MEHAPRSPKPGLAKVRAPALVTRRRVELVALHEGRWRGIVERADVVSEGQSRVEPDGVVYYGTTSLIFGVEPDAGELPRERLELLAALLRNDPHARLRALRVAQREANARAGGPLGPLHAEMTFEATARGVAITIDVTARLRKTRAAGTIA